MPSESLSAGVEFIRCCMTTSCKNKKQKQKHRYYQRAQWPHHHWSYQSGCRKDYLSAKISTVHRKVIFSFKFFDIIGVVSMNILSYVWHPIIQQYQMKLVYVRSLETSLQKCELRFLVRVIYDVIPDSGFLHFSLFVLLCKCRSRRTAPKHALCIPFHVCHFLLLLNFASLFPNSSNL